MNNLSPKITFSNLTKTLCHLSLMSLMALFQINKVSANTQKNYFPLDLNDISILFDRPQKDEGNFLIPPTLTGKKGALISSQLSSHFEYLVNDLGRSKESDWKDLRVVGIRIDPCGRLSASANEPCRKMIRVVWQPFDEKNNKFYDAAAHTFYELSTREFSALVNDVKKYKKENLLLGVSTFRKPLFIHPAFKSQKTRSQFRQNIQNLLSTYCGEKNHVRLTLMKLVTSNLWWRFSGMNKTKDNEWVEIQIAGQNPARTFTQDFFNELLLDKLGMSGVILPVLTHQKDNLSVFIRGPKLRTDPVGIELLTKSIQTINRINNPKVYHSENLDCVQCHIVQSVHQWMEDQDLKLVQKYDTSQDRYTPDFLSGINYRKRKVNLTQKRSHNKSLRAFGYFEDQPSISQRTINESIELLQYF